MSSNKYLEALPAGYTLLWYEVLKVLGKGGFGITYLGRDTNLNQLVAIKEYLPVGIAGREEGSQVHPNSPKDAATFEWGLDRFLKEAQILAKFKHPSIVRVASFFRDSNTAYMVMEYEEGQGLDEVLKQRKTLSEAEIKRILPPLLSGLEMLHAADFIHRDIKPPNILIRKNGTPVILDFGSARQAVAGASDQMTSLLSLGYSPFEQYDSSGNRQGPWSDIYALGGVLYRAVTGEKPVDAAIRIAAKLRNESDPMRSAVELGKNRFSPGFLKAIDKALMVLETDRPQSVAAWRPMLVGAAFNEADQLSATAKREEEKSLSPSPVATQPAPRPASVSTQSARIVRQKKSSWRSFISSINDFGLQSKPVERKHLTVPPKVVVEAISDQPAPSKEELAKMEEVDILDPKLGDVWIEPMTKMEFLWIPAGTFQMGSQKGEAGRKADEIPVHEVYVDGFWMGKYPVTWSKWRRVMGNYPPGLYDPAKDNHPVERVLWEDTQKFLRQYLRMMGPKFRLRLPTEAEWEYAARAGSSTAYYFGDHATALAEYAWFQNNSNNQTQPVGLKAPNQWGLHDMLGNVWEWTEDWHSEDYYSKSPKENPKGAPFGELRVRRGGSWRSNEVACRVAHRNRVLAKSNSNALGFRLVRGLTES
ncbi:MAG: bifunctional serine/threonine-protein kinase/formylglycine-generating enzyme family protein [Magnetococcus sp. DMHC-6]